MGTVSHISVGRLLCKKCKVEKPLSAFLSPRKMRGRMYQQAKCKQCVAEYAKAYRDKNRDHVNAGIRASYARCKDRWVDQRLKRVFGIDMAEYNRMFSEQNGCCACCNRHQSEFNRRLAVDHCHTTNVVRGLLCSSCNHALGHVHDSDEPLQAMIQYLVRAKKRIA